MTGFEPATSWSQTSKSMVSSGNLSEVAATADSRCTNSCTNSPENERGEVVGGSVSSRAESLAIKADSFSAALTMIASLPLSDAEKAQAVRRIMAEQVAAPVR